MKVDISREKTRRERDEGTKGREKQGGLTVSRDEEAPAFRLHEDDGSDNPEDNEEAESEGELRR